MKNNSKNTIDGMSLASGVKKITPQFNRKSEKATNPFWIIVNKEISDHIKSWRFIILISIIALTCLGAMYSALTNIGDALKNSKTDDVFIFLKLFTVSDKTLPSYFGFIAFLGPLLGISLGFDAINSEQNRGTISRILAQPIPRDYFINAKFMASLIVVSVMLMALSLLVVGFGLLTIGIPPTPEEFTRIIIFTLAGILYVAFWLNLAIFFSIRFQQPATSALSGIAVWLFFSVFYTILVDVVLKIIIPTGRSLSIAGEKMKLGILRFSPNQLFSDITTSILMPHVRSLGPLTTQQVQGAIPSPLPVGQSLLLVWPQFVGIVALMLVCFVFSYLSFMKKEIRTK